MEITFDGFIWDKGNWPKCSKHGVSKAEIEFALTNMHFMLPDPFEFEPRLRTAAKLENGRYIFVVFAFRKTEGKNFIRPISARFMHEKEIRSYEKFQSS